MVLICTNVKIKLSGALHMYVCICNNVTENDIENAVRAGARTLDCLADQLAVSTCCGQCACVADECLRVALNTVSAPLPMRAEVSLQLAG